MTASPSALRPRTFDDRLSGAPNFRSVAALPAADGRRVRPGRLFRSDALHRLTDDDLERLARLRIGTVLDLRRDDERASMPTRWPAGAPRDVRTFDVVPDLQAVRAGGWRVLIDAPDFDAERARRWMVETYERMPAALAPAVEVELARLAAPGEDAVLVHCTAGKDRTGFVVAMALAALGVPRDAILDDYLESLRRRPPEQLAPVLADWAGLRPTPRLMGAIETIAGVRAEFLEAALRTVERDHGSIDAYLRGCGLEPGRRAALHASTLD
ncbi:MAG TPA: tyrosine-protein phosphatase [Burkholderiaceae bacterium]|nr:tyrosine-protein phosphatase [Burkholderiaceae bacterium]